MAPSQKRLGKEREVRKSRASSIPEKGLGRDKADQIWLQPKKSVGKGEGYENDQMWIPPIKGWERRTGMRKSRVGSIPKNGLGKKEKEGHDQNQLHPKKKGLREGEGDEEKQGQFHPPPKKKGWGRGWR